MKIPDKNIIAAFLVLLLLGFTLSGVFDRAVDKAFLGSLRDRNVSYLDKSFDKSVKGVLVPSTIKLFAGYLFDCLVFPLAIFFVLFVATRGLLGYAFNLRRDKGLREELLAVLHRYNEKGDEGREQPG